MRTCLFWIVMVLAISTGLPSALRAEERVRDTILARKGIENSDSASIVAALQPLTPRHIAELRLALRDFDPFVRRAAVELLVAAGDAPVTSFVLLLEDDDDAARAAAEKALRASGRAALQPVAEFAMKIPWGNQAKAAAIRILGKIGDPEAVSVLCTVAPLEKSSPFKIDPVLQALRDIGPPAALSLADLFAAPDRLPAACTLLGQLGKDFSVSALNSCIKDQKFGVDRRMRCVQAAECVLPVSGEMFFDAFSVPVLALYQEVLDDAAAPEEHRQRAFLQFSVIADALAERSAAAVVAGNSEPNRPKDSERLRALRARAQEGMYQAIMASGSQLAAQNPVYKNVEINKEQQQRSSEEQERQQRTKESEERLRSIDERWARERQAQVDAANSQKAWMEQRNLEILRIDGMYRQSLERSRQ